jgi:Undecaprenyl-phosphate glucose phosphotransferase
MLSRHRQLFSTAVFLLDAAIIAGSWMAAYELRFHVLAVPAPLGIPDRGLYLWFGAVLTPIALLVLNSFHIYRSARTARLSQELVAVLQGMVIVTALIGLASFVVRGELSRGALAVFAALATFGLCASRLIGRGALHELRRHGRNLRHAIIVGTGEPARLLIEKIESRPDFGLRIRGLVAPVAGGEDTAFGLPVLGTVEDLPEVAERHDADLVYLALARSEHAAEEAALVRLSDSTVSVRLVPDLVRAYTLNASVEDFDGLPVVRVTDSPDQGWNGVLKRGFDLVCSALGLIVLSPLLLAIAIWIKLDSPGPVLHVQERLGLNGRRFRMIKFRTMRADAEAEGAPGWTRPGDPRRTNAGRILRPLSLDELPQLWNVVVGQMSLVGPRPERPVYVDHFRASVPRYMLRHHVKAGITGWAQINGLRGDTPLDRRVEYDLYYINHWSLAFDFKILVLTFVRIFRDASAH